MAAAHSPTSGLVIKNAKLQGVVGIYFDECQHVFAKDGKRTNQQILDSFKNLLKDSRWPLILILSGIPGLASHVAKEEQLARLLRSVRFSEIDLTRHSDAEEMLQLTFSCAKKAGLSFDPLASTEFLDRLTFASCNRWGLVIELLIKAFTVANIKGDKVCTIEHFSEAFANTYSTPLGHSPFKIRNCQEAFGRATLMKMLEKTK